MKAATPATRLERFLAKYDAPIAALARAARRKLRERLPGPVELVYDNYNALVIAFGPSERASEVILSIALYPRVVNLFFLWGAKLPDPERRLVGEGTQVRRVELVSAKTLDEPAVRALVKAALARAKVPLDPAQPRRLVIRSISAKQRPRRPAAKKA
jgi:hypothetical protein